MGKCHPKGEPGGVSPDGPVARAAGRNGGVGESGLPRASNRRDRLNTQEPKAMKIALCNEVIRDLAFSAQCELAAALGYSGLEVAPFTLGENPHRLPAGVRARLRREASEAGISITGLHWLLLTPPGLSITTPDNRIREKTLEIIQRLIDLCADLGGRLLVHGSPNQRQVNRGEDPVQAWNRARDLWATIARHAAQTGVTYCLEPLAPQDTRFINTIGTAVDMMKAVDNPSFRTMIDTRAASRAEASSIPRLIDEWLPSGAIAHIHLNDTSGLAPGQGALNFAPILEALQRNGYAGAASVEPFEYRPDGRTAAARAMGYLQGLLDGLSTSSDSRSREAP